MNIMMKSDILSCSNLPRMWIVIVSSASILYT